MKKIIIGTLFLGFAAVSVQAQEVKKEHKGHKGDHSMHESLNLTAEQKAKMKELNEQHKKSMEALLTPEQKTKLEQLKAERKAKGEKFAKDHKRGGKGFEKDRLASMKADLGLTDAQVEQLKKNSTEMRASMKAIHENTALTPEKKKEEMAKLRKKSEENMKSVLTPEQMEKMKARRK